MSISHKPKADCCGCNACSEICPKHCIEMQSDKYGFLYPCVDKSICIECGACERVCPFPASAHDLNIPQTAYAAWLKDKEICVASSSGGAAYAICSKVLRNGGVVYGCTADGIDVCHIRVEKIEDLKKLQGSKYVQSDVRELFSEVRHDLKNWSPVVFIGTPCQVAGLKKFLKNIPDNLLLVDLICHGTPSLQMLKDHIAYVAPNKCIDNISFREGNSQFILSLSQKKEKIWRADVWSEPLKDMYYRAFMDGISYRPSCHVCTFARAERASDITIGDFWGLGEIDSSGNKAHSGISLILPATAKGLDFTKGLAEDMELIERTVAEAVDGNNQLRHPVAATFRTRLFFRLYPYVSFDMAVRIVTLKMFVRCYIKKVLGILGLR